MHSEMFRGDMCCYLHFTVKMYQKLRWTGENIHEQICDQADTANVKVMDIRMSATILSAFL